MRTGLRYSRDSTIAARNPRQLSDGSIIDDHGFVYTRNANGSVTSRVATADQLADSGVRIDFDNLSTANLNGNPPQSATPRNQVEADAFDRVRANLESGSPLNLGNDARFSENDFVKRSLTVQGPSGRNFQIHYQYNPTTGQLVDLKGLHPLETLSRGV